MIVTVRPGTTDRATVRENFNKRIYFRHFQPRHTDTWLDAGAHIGTFSLSIAPKVRRVFAFEPDAGNYDLLVRNVTQNQLTKVVAFRGAVTGNDAETRTLYLSRDARTQTEHSMVVARGRVAFSVPAYNIRTILNGVQINCLKLDVEGAEYEILGALSNAEIERVDRIAMEAHIWVAQGLRSYRDLVARLNSTFEYVEAPDATGSSPTAMVYAWRSGR